MSSQFEIDFLVFSSSIEFLKLALITSYLFILDLLVERNRLRSFASVIIFLLACNDAY